MSLALLTRWALRLGVLGLGLGGCIIEERVYDSHLAACDDYCRRIEAACPRAYDRPAVCMSVCMLMEEGDTLGGSTENTVTCRLDRLRERSFEPATDCDAVGPGSNGACGTNCDALCSLRGKVCGDIPGQATLADVADEQTCLRDCAAVPDIGGLDADRDERGDSVQCRLVHISEASLNRNKAYEHCQHTQTIPVPGEDPAIAPCSDPVGLPMQEECRKYCSVVMGACDGEFAVYASQQQCLQACNQMTPGEPGDLNGDTIRCRRYHSYSALSLPATHCTHAGPTGDGHCGGGNCAGYCRTLRAGCPMQFAATYGPNEVLANNDCEARCESLDGAKTDQFVDNPPRYNGLTSNPGNTLQCRTFHAVQALGAPNDAAQCAAAFGDSGTECR